MLCGEKTNESNYQTWPDRGKRWGSGATYSRMEACSWPWPWVLQLLQCSLSPHTNTPSLSLSLPLQSLVFSIKSTIFEFITAVLLPPNRIATIPHAASLASTSDLIAPSSQLHQHTTNHNPPTTTIHHTPLLNPWSDTIIRLLNPTIETQLLLIRSTK